MLVLAVVAAAALAAGCGDDDGGGNGGPNHVDNPMPAAGGGVSNGAVNGELNVFVIDGLTKEPIASADVRVIRGGDQESLAGATSATGLVTFTDAALAGAQDITVEADGYAPASWFGANGAVVTIPLASTSEPAAPDTAQVSGSIEGWTDLPAPDVNHLTVALVLYSFTKNLDAPENKIQQPAGAPGTLPPNSCVRTPALSPACAWELVTRTGAQSHYAIIVDVDTKGTAEDTDDTYEVIGFAGATGITLNANQTLTNEMLTMVPAGDIADLTVTFPASAPAGLGQLTAIPLMQLGDERLIFAFPGLTPAAPTARLPKTTGVFAGATWTLVGQAKGASADPSTTIFKHDIDPAATVALGEFLALPAGLAESAGGFSYTGAAGASLHTAEIRDPNNNVVWNGVFLAEAPSPFLLDFATDPLPMGTLTFKVGAVEIAGFDAQSFAIDDLVDDLDRLSSQVVTFTH